MTFPLPILILTGAVALAIGILIGRLTGNNRREVGELRTQLETSGKERELAQASVEAAKDEIQRTRDELDSYRGDVVEHFTGTSQLLRDLTHQYRAVYDHLATSASNLCPDGSVNFLESLQSEQLDAGAAEPSPDLADESAEASAEAESEATAAADGEADATKDAAAQA